ncbi:MAG: phage regulatory CII family protein [Gammaproteobacteria bacterium]|nr:phage regulatory CII family protein [Gammaproteobacteria bacterium]MBU1978627.1 phage regulatory CII family protein [Gammaproteobacteria bacterium]
MKTSIPDDVFDAFYRVVHDFAKGVPKLAAKMGMSAGTLYNKANTNDNENNHNKPTLADAVLVSAITGDHRILHAFAHTLGEVCFPVPDLSHVSDAALLELITKIGAEGGDFYRAVNKAMADGKFTKGELKVINLEALEFVAAIVEAVQRMKGLVDE